MALFDPKMKTIALHQKSIDEKNASIIRYFDEIGRLYYGQYRDASADVSKEINSRCDAITALHADIEVNNLKILFEKGLKLCTTCKKENPLEHTFCSVCGARFPDGSDKKVDLPQTQSASVLAAAADAAADAEQKAPVSDEPAPVEAIQTIIPAEDPNRVE